MFFSMRRLTLCDGKNTCTRAKWITERLQTHVLQLTSEAIGPSAGIAVPAPSICPSPACSGEAATSVIGCFGASEVVWVGSYPALLLHVDSLRGLRKCSTSLRAPWVGDRGIHAGAPVLRCPT